MDKIWEEIDKGEELYDFVADKYWSEWWPEHYINKRDVDTETPEELVESLYEANEFAQFGFPYE